MTERDHTRVTQPDRRMADEDDDSNDFKDGGEVTLYEVIVVLWGLITRTSWVSR